MSLNTLPGALRQTAVGGKFLYTLEDNTSSDDYRFWEFKMLGYFFRETDLSEFITAVDDNQTAKGAAATSDEDAKEGADQKLAVTTKLLVTKKMVAAGRKIYGLLSEVLGRSLFKLHVEHQPWRRGSSLAGHQE